MPSNRENKSHRRHRHRHGHGHGHKHGNKHGNKHGHSNGNRHDNYIPQPVCYYGEDGWYNYRNSKQFLQWEVVNEIMQTRIRAMKYGRLPNDEGDYFEQNYPRKRWFNAWEPIPN